MLPMKNIRYLIKVAVAVAAAAAVAAGCPPLLKLRRMRKAGSKS